MGQYLMDTSVVSDYFSASYSTVGMTFMDMAIDAIPTISVMTQIELLCWNTDEATTKNIEEFIADSIVLDISPDIIAYCVSLRKGKKIKTPDAIIAATEQAHGYTLITSNEKDFVNLKGLKIVNPHKL